MFALGLLSWLYDRPAEGTLTVPRDKFASKPEICRPTSRPSRPAGTTARPPRRSRSSTRSSRPACRRAPYRNITGNTALAYGLVAAGQLAGLPLFLGSYPITPASDILHELSKHKRFGVRTFQAEDEIAGVGAALGASFGGALGVTTTSGPGMCAQGRDHRPGRDGRAAADRLRRPAGRPVHRHADQDRAGRPAAGAVRPQRRVAGRRCWPRPPRRTASTPRSRRPGSRSSTAPR